MEYSRVLDLDWLQLYYSVLYEPIKAAAIPIEGGKVIIPDTLCIGADSKIFCTLKCVQIDEPQTAAITARQLYEYEKAHGCNLLKQYSDCGKIYDIYGYTMHAAACELKGKEYAQKWLRKWQAGKAAALNIWRTAAACDDRTGKFTLACFQSFVDLENAAPDDDITTYADIDRIRAEVHAVCRREPQQLNIDPIALESIKGFVYESKIDLQKFAAACIDLYNAVGAKEVAYLLYQLWSDKNKMRQTTERGKIKPLVKWATFRDEFAKACGMNMPNYKPNVLKQYQPPQRYR